MSYIVTRSFYEGNTLHTEGDSFAHADQTYVEKLLADGNISAASSQPTQEAPANQVPLENVPQEPSTPLTPSLETPPEVAPPQPPQAPTVSTTISPQEQQIRQDIETLEPGSAPSSNGPHIS